MAGVLALPVLSATTASAAPVAVSAAPASSYPSKPPLPYEVHAKAMAIRSKANSKPTALGVLYKNHKISVARESGNCLCITDKTTGFKGWVPGTYVYRDVRMRPG
ncbi:SH3 domain-containing protein [Streptomyces sp. NPDC021080]|uniref:SH3 domain-containing protein n=1 Tax=Streptomyces sp. NPDC021080 TaxID=3365110 RepID=UPI0037A08FF9